jgi:hypothetical protein
VRAGWAPARTLQSCQTSFIAGLHIACPSCMADRSFREAWKNEKYKSPPATATIPILYPPRYTNVPPVQNIGPAKEIPDYG